MLLLLLVFSLLSLLLLMFGLSSCLVERIYPCPCLCCLIPVFLFSLVVVGCKTKTLVHDVILLLRLTIVEGRNFSIPT